MFQCLGGFPSRFHATRRWRAPSRFTTWSQAPKPVSTNISIRGPIFFTFSKFEFFSNPSSSIGLPLSFELWNDILSVYNFSLEAKLTPKKLGFSRNLVGLHQIADWFSGVLPLRVVGFLDITIFYHFLKVWSVSRNWVKFQFTMMFEIREMRLLRKRVKTRNVYFFAILSIRDSFCIFWWSCSTPQLF